MIGSRTPARRAHPADQGVRPIASALLSAGGWALTRRGTRRLGAALLVASVILVARQRGRAERES